MGAVSRRVMLVVLGLGIGLLAAEVVLRAAVGLGLLGRGHPFVTFLNALDSEPVAGSIYRESDDPEIGIELIPGARRHHLRINSHGFRGPEVSVEPPSDTNRIVVLGDSETFGALLEESETLPGQLEQELSRLDPDVHYEALNFGCPGYNTRQELAVLQRRAIPFRPDVVVLVYVLNDAFLGNQTALVQPSTLLRSYVWAFGTFVASRHRPSYYELLHHHGDLVEQYRAHYASEEFADCTVLLRRMAAFLDERDVRFVVLIAPEIIGFDDLEAYPFRELHSRLMDALPDSVEVVDALDDVAALGLPPRELWITPTDCHKNAVVTAVMARALAEGLLAPP